MADEREQFEQGFKNTNGGKVHRPGASQFRIACNSYVYVGHFGWKRVSVAKTAPEDRCQHPACFGAGASTEGSRDG